MSETEEKIMIKDMYDLAMDISELITKKNRTREIVEYALIIVQDRFKKD